MNHSAGEASSTPDWFFYARWAAFGSAAAAMVSVALSQSLLGISIFCLLLSRRKWQLPEGFVWLCAFAGWTLLSLAFSPDPTGGLPQIRKLYVWLLLFVLVTTLRSIKDFMHLLLVWCGLATLGALRGIWQFWAKWHAAAQTGTDFYQSYVGARITGFMSHWMTFSSQMLFGLLAALALLLFASFSKKIKLALAGGAAVIAVALVLAITRGVWIAAAAGGVYLLCMWRRWTVVLIPLAAILLFLFGPEVVRSRLTSLVKPHGETDSNQHRIVTWRTGVRIIEAHPLLGVGPEQVGKRFEEYIPADIPRPLPDGWYLHLHNIYLQYSAERGIPAAVFILLFLFSQFRMWVVRFRSQALPHWAFHAATALLIGVMVTGLFEHNLGDSEILALTLGLFGGMTVCCREA